MNALVTIFPEADIGSKDISRMYFGGKGLLYFDESIPTIDIESLIRNMCLYLKNVYGDTNYKRKIAEFTKNTGIKLNKNKLPDISIVENIAEQPGTSCSNIYNNNNKISPNPIIVLKANGDNLLNQYYQINTDTTCTSNCSADKKAFKIHAPYRSSTINDLSNSCQLFNEFEIGNRTLSHDELFGIATNIIQIESGTKKFKDILTDNSYYSDNIVKYNNWNYYLNYMKQNEYKPKSCNLFCPYKDKCKHGTSILTTAKTKYHTIEKLANYEEYYYPIEEVEKDVKRSIIKAVESADTKFHIIKAQTSVGKTETYLNLMKNSSAKWLIAVPTIILKNDVYKRAKEMEVNVIETPSLHEIKDSIPEENWSYIMHLYQTGKYNLVNPYINKIVREQDIPCLREYLKRLKEFENFEGSVITTHRKLLNLDERILQKYDNIIIDEDIIFKSIIPNQYEMPVSVLKKLLKTNTDSRLRDKIKKVFKYSKTKSLFTLPHFEWEDKDDTDGTSTPIDIPSFCLAEHFYYRKASEEKNLHEDSIVFFKHVKFKNVKYIIVSATVDETICNYYFGADKVKFYNCKKARYKGILNQYYDKSMSRACIDENSGIIERIKKWTCNRYTITFKKYNEGELYFGNAEGCNHLAGENIDVIGTPYQTEFLYKLFPYTIGLDFDDEAELKPNNTVTHNGYKFRFTTYDDEVLRNVHFWMIESELEQAVGRARLLRCNCTVNLFSNFPLCQSILKESEY